MNFLDLIPKCGILEDIYYNYLRNDIRVCVNKMVSPQKYPTFENIKVGPFVSNGKQMSLKNTSNIFQGETRDSACCADRGLLSINIRSEKYNSITYFLFIPHQERSIFYKLLDL